jgi:hypothetical protein
MTESERDLLMPFLRQLVNTRTAPDDVAASNLIKVALRKQPNAGYLLVQRALTLDRELATAQNRILQLEGKASLNEAVLLTADFLNPQTAGWGEQVDRNSGLTTSKRLYDFFKQTQSPQKMDLESRAVSFIANNSSRIWLVILVLATVVVIVRNEYS